MPSTEKRLLSLELPEAHASEIAVALAALAECRRRTKTVLAAVGPRALDWRPPVPTSGSSHSIATLIYHVAATELEWCGDLLGQAALLPEDRQLLPWGVRDASGQLVPAEGEPVAPHLQRPDAARDRLLSIVAPMTLREYRRPREGPEYAVTAEWVVHHLTQHEAEHRGQLAQLHRRAEAALSRQAAV